MNKLKEQLRLRMLGQLSDEKTNLDINNAYSVAVDFAVLFTSFCRENYHIETEGWSYCELPLDKVQQRDNYDIVDIKEVLNKFLECLK